MKNTWLIALREFRQLVRSRGFLLASIGTPLILMIIWLATGAFEPTPATVTIQAPEDAVRSGTVIGYVDRADLIHRIPENVPADLFVPYDDEADATWALEQDEIQAYYLVPADYRQTGEIRRVSRQLSPEFPDQNLFNWILVGNLLPDASADELSGVRWPLAGGPRFVSISAEKNVDSGPNMMMPMMVTMMIMIPLFTSGGYLLRSLAKEKGSRVIEMLLVSVRPRQLLTGKLLGMGALSLVQYLFWGIIVWGATQVAGGSVTDLLSGINLVPSDVLLLALYALGGFTLYSAIMAGLGAMSPDMESSRVWTFVISLPMTIPIYLWQALVTAPNGPLAVALSLFPLSSPIAMVMRITSATVPTWQMALSLALLALSAVGIVWLMARLFRVHTLLSGEAPSLRRMWSALRMTTS
ncbi:MAG TPA: ABC transporter permease [Chloroflexi bacterium]|jgi:ABC-2 type transport system permease protein|nr:ABC transporter permease [Chloroflexota bacterium]